MCVWGTWHDYLLSLSLAVSWGPGRFPLHLSRLLQATCHGSKALQSELDEFVSKCQPCPLQDLGPYTNHLTAFCLSFLNSEMQIMILHSTGERSRQGIPHGWIACAPGALLGCLLCCTSEGWWGMRPALSPGWRGGASGTRRRPAAAESLL